MKQENVIGKFPQMLHGGDYNPDQWLDRPDILLKDVELMKAANVNCVSLGIFAWARLEPSEGTYELDWLEEIISRLYENGIYTILATPSGAKPVWMADKYEEVRRVSSNLTRELKGVRHNHCYTSPIYREKVWQINQMLAKRFSDNLAVILWHLSNEYGGECYCPLCQQAFREWLKNRYGSVDALNKAWWTDFWSHHYDDWSQIEAPVPSGERFVHGLTLDWKRFVTHQTADFAKWERDSVKSINPDIPVTINMMGTYEGLNYFKFKDIIDISSWDSYPLWHGLEQEAVTGHHTAFEHDLMRSIKREPFILMESTPSATNWQSISKLKRPGMHMLSSMQAVAHGSNAVHYFQWRKSRGSSEKFHGAVVDHYGESDTRVFRDVTEVGKCLKGLEEITKTCPKPEVAILFDWENRWAIEAAAGPRNSGMHYLETVMAHHKALWQRGIATDIVDMECSIDRYKLVIAPMAYLLRGGFSQRLMQFVKAGGTVVGTYWSGIVDESDLCFLGGMPGEGLMALYGLRSEEIDALYDGQSNQMMMKTPMEKDTYQITELCDLVHCTTAEVLAEYGEDFYKGKPALTRNQYGKGQAFYIAAHVDDEFYQDFYSQLATELSLETAIDATLPEGVTAIKRKGETDYIFLQNFTEKTQKVQLKEDLTDVTASKDSSKTVKDIELKPFDIRILRKN